MPAPRRDLDAIRARLLGWLRARLPHARALELGPLTGPAATGFSSDTLLFELAWQEEGRRVVRGLACRLQPTGPGVFPRYDVVQQARVMEALRPTGVPVPAVLWLERDPDPLGSPVFVMERIEGRIPTDTPPYHGGGWVTEIAPEERRALWESAVDTLAEIHRQDPAALGLDFLEAPPPRSDTVGWQIEHWARYADWVTGDRRQRLLDEALAWLRARRPADPEPPRLCWGDARIGNMIFRDGRCVAVLDWEMATLGPPEMDLAWFLYMDRHHCEGIGVPRLPGFPGRDETVARWERRVGRRARDLAWWEAFAGFRFAAIMARVAQQMHAVGLLPPDSTFAENNTASQMLARELGLPPPGSS
ncbi:MAG TPA: phosphotransferase family protein [Myxococcota bacterium]